MLKFLRVFRFSKYLNSSFSNFQIIPKLSALMDGVVRIDRQTYISHARAITLPWHTETHYHLGKDWTYCHRPIPTSYPEQL